MRMHARSGPALRFGIGSVSKERRTIRTGWSRYGTGQYPALVRTTRSERFRTVTRI
jgi:hypothetical protein